MKVIMTVAVKGSQVSTSEIVHQETLDSAVALLAGRVPTQEVMVMRHLLLDGEQWQCTLNTFGFQALITVAPNK